jgi:N-acetyl-anhydromuramyl-L-alanine amidase AmpD
VTAPDQDFAIDDSWLLPLEPGQAVDAGWPAATGHRPHGVTWHWTATWDLATCNRLLGGPRPERRGVASAHYAIGRSLAEGVARYVRLEDRAWHAGRNQRLRHDGRPYRTDDDKGARTTIGIETVNIGYARDGVPATPGWLAAHGVEGAPAMQIQPWTDEQVAMMAAVGREVVARWPQIGPRDHHGHHDLCPGYKVDVAGFPFARVLAGIYGDPELPDVWSPFWTNAGRKQALRRLGYLSAPLVDDAWYRADDLALRRLQADHGLDINGWWTTWVCWKVWELLREREG